jgi:hypothetical protein
MNCGFGFRRVVTADWQSLSCLGVDRRRGAVAQLGARLNGIQKVRGSNPLSSTYHRSILTTMGYQAGWYRGETLRP